MPPRLHRLSNDALIEIDHVSFGYDASRLILNDWQLSGIIQFQSGTPTNFSYSFSSGVSNQNRQTTGQERYGPRPVFVADWRIPEEKMNEFVQSALVRGARIEEIVRHREDLETLFLRAVEEVKS